jgi:hypothetical protein
MPADGVVGKQRFLQQTDESAELNSTLAVGSREAHLAVLDACRTLFTTDL